MTTAGRGPAAIDTGVLSARLGRTTKDLVERYAPLIEGRPMVASFVSDAEIRFGARKGRWGPARLARMEQLLNRTVIVWPGPELTGVYVGLREWCERAGHGLAGRAHEADRWIAATAMRHGVPLVTHDRIFLGVDGLNVSTMLDP